jgi:hypothetical protein
LGAELQLLCGSDENSTTVRGMVICGKNETVHVCHKKDNGTLYQREHCTSKYSVKYTIHKTLTTMAKSPVKIFMDSK